MPYFMINVHAESGIDRNFEVQAATSGRALVRVLEHLGALDLEVLLHGVHVGAPYDQPADDSTWDEEDKFERVSGV